MLNETAVIEARGTELAAKEETAAQSTLTVAQSYVIDSPEMAEAAADDLGQIKARLKALDEQRKSITKPLDEAKARIMDLFRKPQQLLDQAERTLKSALITWQEAERQKAEAIRRAQEESARKIREEQERQAREAAEAAVKAEADAKAAAAAGDAEKAAELQAEAEQQAQAAVVAAETAETLQHMAPVAVAAPAKLAGVSTREEWKCECTDLMALVKAVAAGQASIELLSFNQAEANKRAKALRSEFKVPGVRVFPITNLAARASR